MAAQPGAEFPWVQWVNRGSDLDPRREAGGFFIPVENLALMGEPELAGSEAATLNFGEGGSSTGVFLNFLDMAVLATRFAWLTKDDRDRRDRGTLSPTWTDGARGKLQALVLLRTAAGWTGPVIVTLTGTVTSDFSAAVKTHRQQVIRATSGKGAAPWFWARLEPGSPEKRGHGSATSTVTPILLQGEVDPSTAYVGDEAADWMEENFDVIQAWGAAWKAVGQTESQAPPEPDFDDDLPSTPDGSLLPSAGQTPMMDARMRFGATWNRLTELGCKPANLNNAWDLPTINQATALMEAALRSVQSGANISSVQLDLLARMGML
jgi:hypothetical protein